MNKARIRLILAVAVCLYGFTVRQPAPVAQQSNTLTTVEQEFFDNIKKGNAEKVAELLKQQPELIKARSKNGTSPVLFAVFTGQKGMAESLIATGVEPNIFEAAATGRIERLRELIRKDPQSVKAFSSDGWTALHLNWGNPQIAEVLLDSGSDINAISKNRFIATPLQSAVAAKWTAVARFLIDRGADVNCRGDGGFSPLHEAAGSGQLEIARLLLEHGAKTDAKTEGDKTPLTIAIEFKQEELARLLREWKAKS